MVNLAPIPCAARVPPRCKGRTKCPCECHAGLPAAIKALSSEIVAKTAPRVFQNPAQRHLKPTKIEPRGTHESPDATKSAQEAFQRHPRGAQKRPRARQESPRPAQQVPRSRPNLFKIGPGALQDLIFTRSWPKPLFRRPLGRVLLVFCVARWMVNMLRCAFRTTPASVL